MKCMILNKLEHLEHLKMVLKRLEENQLIARVDKCDFMKKEVEFLGHVDGQDGIKVDERKIEVIREWKSPQTVKEVRSFLGLASYYRRFIDRFADIAAPLHELLKKTKNFTWTVREETAFGELKKALTEAPVLITPDFSKRFIVTCDLLLEQFCRNKWAMI
jgi:hypothetical protein